MDTKDKVTVKYLNSVYIRVECERSISKELHEHFSFFVDGYQFTPKFKNKVWDGKIRLYNINTNKIYVGLISNIKEFCVDNDYQFECDSSLEYEDEFSVYHAKKFFESLNLSSNGKKIVTGEHQQGAFIHAMQTRRALLLSPTASGKSLIIYLLFRQFLEYQDLNGLIIVPNVGLVEQLFSDFEDYAMDDIFVIDDNVHKIYEGKSKITNKKLIISTYQSIFNMPQEYFESFDYVMVDECHQATAKSITSIMDKCVNTKYRIGLTGTLDGSKTNKLVLEGMFGPVKQVTTTKELMDNGTITELEIKCLILKHPDPICEILKKAEYKDEMSYIIGNESRNKFIKNLAISLENNTLILFQMIDKHGKLLYNMIKDAENIGDRKVFFIHGGVDVDDREMIRKLMETETNSIICASYGTFSTGTNVKNLHNVIFASPYRSKIKVFQSIGRSLRLFNGKSKATLFDIADDIRCGTWMNHTLKHFVIRVKLYTEEKFKYKTYKIGLK